jgi:3',5'-cyclic AMP phosphodiesterase CpdA
VIAHISDLHVGREPIAGEQLEDAVGRILALPQQPDAVLIGGDLTDHATPEEYEYVHAGLAPLTMPVHVVAGNHDDRALLRETFGAPGVGDEPIRYAVDCGDLRLVVADTTIPGRDEGRIDVEWIAAALDEDRDTPTILALHHPPVAIGIPAIDGSIAPPPERLALADVLRRSPQVRRLVAGHDHRTAVATLGGCPVLLLGSTQVALHLDFAATEFDMRTEPPLLAVHRMVDGELVSHVQPV